jgi:hypothetical protein
MGSTRNSDELSPLERSALVRVALGKGDLIPVHVLYARKLERQLLVRLIPPAEEDYVSKLTQGEVWCSITDHGRRVNAALLESRA